jgi:hypothetical protein
MSKEMLVIALGVWIILVRTFLGVPGEWQTLIFIATGVVLVIIGFLLRGEALGRSSSRARQGRGSAYTFVENSPATSAAHEEKQGITSLN